MDAIALLENSGLRVMVQGRGKVVSQSLTAGQKIVVGSQIVLRLG